MGKLIKIQEELMKKLGTVVCSTKTFCSDGIRFRIGWVDKLPHCYLAVSVSQMMFTNDGLTLPAIVFSLDDIKDIVEKYGLTVTRRFLRFAIGHELGHMTKWSTELQSENGGFVDDIWEEIRADIYSVEHNNMSITDYRKFMKILNAGANNIVVAAVSNIFVSKLASLSVSLANRKRTKYAVREMTMLRPNDTVEDQIYDDVIRQVLNQIQ